MHYENKEHTICQVGRVDGHLLNRIDWNERANETCAASKDPVQTNALLLLLLLLIRD